MFSRFQTHSHSITVCVVRTAYYSIIHLIRRKIYIYIFILRQVIRCVDAKQQQQPGNLSLAKNRQRQLDVVLVEMLHQLVGWPCIFDWFFCWGWDRRNHSSGEWRRLHRNRSRRRILDIHIKREARYMLRIIHKYII